MKQIKLTEHNIKEAIRDVINEAFYNNGYKRSNWYGKSSYKPSQKQPGVPRQGNLKIARCLFDDQSNQVIVHLGHVFADGARELANAIRSKVPADIMGVQTSDGANGGPRVILTVDAKNKERVKDVVNELRQAIESVQDYTDDSIDYVCDKIYDSIDAVATQEDIDNADKLRASNWREMLQRLQDPAVRQALLMYQTTDNYSRLYGNTLSMGNVKQVLEQRSDACFVTEKSVWKRLFNRSIKPGAQRIIVTKPVLSRDASWDELNNAARILGYRDYNFAKRNYGSSPQVMGVIKFKAEEKIPRTYVKTIMYDVMDTIPPSDPSLDVWTNEIGLSNNITGILNQKAAEEDVRLNGDKKETADALKKKIEGMNANAMSARRSILQRRCDRLRIDTTPFSNLDDPSFVVRAAYEYAKNQSSRFNVIRPADVAKLAALTAMAVGLSSGIDNSVTGYAIPNEGRVHLRTGATVSEEEAMNVKTLTDQLIPTLAKAVRINKVDPIVDNKKNEGIDRSFKFTINEKTGNGEMLVSDFLSELVSSYGVNDMMGNEEQQAYESLCNKIGKLVSEEIKRSLRK